MAALLEQLARRFITFEWSAVAQETFLRSNDRTGIAGHIAAGFRYHVAEADGKLIGFIGVRDNSHLYHLFVADDAQRKGVGRQLWKVAKAACDAFGNPGRFTVNSSNNAVKFYESLGFVRSAPQQERDGVLYNPMCLVERDPLHSPELGQT